MFNLIKYTVDFFNIFYSILIVSLVCLSLSILFYYYNYKKLSFFLIHLSLTYYYFFFILTKNISSISMTYFYYGLVFLFYHFYFTFSKRFYYRTMIVLKNYLNNFEYVKLILWVVLIFIPALLGEAFIFLMVFNPLFAFSLATANFKLFFFLLIEWVWMFGLIFSNKFNIFNHFLLKIQNYFSRKGCLHYIGTTQGKRCVKK